MSAETSSVYKKFKKLKLAIKRSKNSNNEVGTQDTRKRGSVGNRMPRSVAEDAIDAVLGTKRKRVYAVQGMDEERSPRRDRDRNDSFKKGTNRFRENYEKDKWKDSLEGDANVDRKESVVGKFSKSQRTMWAPNKKGNGALESKQPYRKGRETAENAKASKGKSRTTGRMVDIGETVEVDGGHNFSRKKFAERNSDSSKRFSQSRSKSSDVDSRKPVEVDNAHNFSRKKFAESNSDSSKQFSQTQSKSSDVDRRKPVEVDSGHSFSRKKFAESNSDTSKQFSQGWSKISDVSHVKTWKKTAQNKKVLDNDSSLTDDQPRKRKRIRLDPHDTSNKRLEDSVVIKERIKEKKEDMEKDDKLSMNAQFRAIQPSPSILSFVEDNFLGRRRLIELRRAGYDIELSAPLDNLPSSTSSERARIEENIFRNKLTFFAAAKVSSSFPPPELPEIAFAGRSNVGKSSLLNALTRQWGVVRTSDKPGLTQTINFFKLGLKDCLVDLPGYGFAYAKEEVKDAWEELVKEYVSTRIGLSQVCLLIDTKWGMKPRDRELIDLMERFQTKYQIVLTKTDTVFPIDVARRAMQIEESLKANKSVVHPVMMVSSKSGAGIRSLRTVLAKVARFAKL